MKHETKCVCESCLIHKWKTATQKRIAEGKQYKKDRRKSTWNAYRCYLAYMKIRKIL